MKSLKYLALLILIVPFLFSCSESTTDLKTVATPVITPAGGTYTATQNVTITCETIGATIVYTTNGATPTDSSAVYAGPISVAMDITIKAMAFKPGWNDSPVVTTSYVIYNDMVSVPAGTFTMGRTIGSGYADELPTHPVTLNAFFMSKYEVKQAEWLSIMGSNPSFFFGDVTKPVEQVTYYAVLAYCNKRSIAESLTPVYSIGGSTNPTDWGVIPSVVNATWDAATANLSANGYRLPTEAEWEYAARGATNTPDLLYSGSNSVADVSWYADNAGNTTHSVGMKQANALGIYDMSGNVQEWVWDWYSSNYYSVSPGNNPTGPATGTLHSIRGGSWDQTSDASRVVFRNWGTPEKGEAKVNNSRLGFRVVRSAL